MGRPVVSGANAPSVGTGVTGSTVPKSLMEITPSWLTGALHSKDASGRASVTGYSAETIAEGKGFLNQVFRLRLHYDDDPLELPKPKPRWDVHLAGDGNRVGSLAGVFRPLIAGPSGSGASPRLSCWSTRPGNSRPAAALPPCCPIRDCPSPPLSPSPRWPHQR